MSAAFECEHDWRIVREFVKGYANMRCKKCGWGKVRTPSKRRA